MIDQVAPIYKAIEYIESHLQENIVVAQIAEAAGYSLFHFMRKFNQMVHHTPYDYLMRRRLTEAANALIHGKQRIIDIGQDYCFNDQETFSRVFRKMFQKTPSQCRKEKSFPFYRLMSPLTMDDLLYINSSDFNPPMIRDVNELQLVGLMTALVEEKTENELQRDHIFTDLIGEYQFLAQTTLYEIDYQVNSQKHSRYCFIGFEDSQLKNSHPHLVRQIVNNGKFAIMEIPESKINLATRYIYSTWITGSGLSIKNDMTIMCWPYIMKNTPEQMKTLMVPVVEE